MNASSPLLAKDIWIGPLPPVAEGGLARPRIGIAGIAIESSTFSPHISGDEAFTERRGEELQNSYGFLGVDDELGAAAEWVPLLQARSLPGGPVDPATFRRLHDEIIGLITANGPFDGFWLDIHGAMSVVGMDDAEGVLATDIRSALGDDVLVSTSMDLHGNVSRPLLDASDLITCYRMAPHEDARNTKHRAVHHLLARLRAATGSDVVARRPYKAWRQVPVLLPGEKTSTRLEPAKSIYDEVPVVADLDGVVDAAIWVGYAWADEPRNQAAVVVTGDNREVIAAETERLASLYWQARADFVFVADALPLDDSLDAALASDARPFLISDSGDNPTAGGCGDVSWTLGQLLGRADLAPGGEHDQLTVVHASIFDPAAVAAAREAGVGAVVGLEVGGRIDSRPSGPVTISGTVFSITDGDPTAGTQVVIKSGAVHAIITERRKPFHHLDDFATLGLDPHACDIIVVKIGYLQPELYDLAADWKLGLTPGGVDQDLVRLGHHRLPAGTYPFVTDGPDPDLAAVVTRRGE